MIFYNSDKTKKLKEEDIDLSKGYIIESEEIIHHEGVPGVKEKGHYETIAEYKNEMGEVYGSDVEWIVDEPAIPEIYAYDEIVPIAIYIEYTDEQLLEMKKDELRERRQKECFDVIDRAAWFSLLNEYERNEVMLWRKAWLDVTNTLEVPEEPIAVKNGVDYHFYESYPDLIGWKYEDYTPENVLGKNE